MKLLKIQTFLSILLLLITNLIIGQPFYTKYKDSIILNNDRISRTIYFQNDSFYSSILKLDNCNQNYIKKSMDFSFAINDSIYTGFSGWTIDKINSVTSNTGGNGVQVVLHKTNNNPNVSVALYYMLYPDLPIIRKWMTITNRSNTSIKLERVNIEDLHTRLSFVHSVVYHNYARMKHLGTFTGNWHDPLVVVHQIRQRRGIALGNETIGVLKRTAYHTKENNVEIGLTHTGQDFPFRKWIAKNQTWESPKIFIALYSDTDDGYKIVESEINMFKVKYLNIKVINRKQKPVFVYNTWYPFRTYINDSLVRSVAKAAAACGIQEFVLDDGWQVNKGGKTSEDSWGNNYGDWEVDTTKFPGGLKPTFDYIRSLGMKPGLWISIGSATKDAQVFKEHPEWFVKNKNNQLTDLHLPHDQSDFYTSCFGTGWFNYIKKTILRLVNEHGLAYAKLDFAAVTSAYVNNNTRSGCYATNHPYHKDHLESYWVIYQRVIQLFDELHKEAPQLFIDCTFETAGKLQLMDYAIAQHADGNWLANFESRSPIGPLRVRQMAWWRSPVLPAASLVIGNQAIDDPDFEFSLKSLIGTLPIVLGDPRKISDKKIKMIKNWSDWMQKMQQQYDYMAYRKDLTGFGEPRMGAWDGWQRINFQDKNGGIFGVFRQGAHETTRIVVLQDLMPEILYSIHEAPHGKQVYQATGEKLMQDGLKITISKEYDGKIYEIRSTE